MRGPDLLEEWMTDGLGGLEKQKEGREGEMWLVCKMNNNFKIKNEKCLSNSLSQ